MKTFTLSGRNAALLVLCLNLPVAAAFAAPQSVTLRYKFTPGQVARTKTVMDFNYTLSGLPGGSTPVAVKMHTAQVWTRTVQSVAADGSATLLVHQDSLDTTFSMNGQPQSLPADPSVSHDILTLVMTPTGKVLSSQTLGTTGVSNPMQGMDMSKMEQLQGRLDFPDTPVNVGDSWKAAISLDKVFDATAMSGLTASTAEQSTLESVSPAGMATINQTAVSTFGGGASPTGQALQIDGTMSGAGTYMFDNSAGQDTGYSGVYTLNMKITIPQMANPMTMQGQMTLHRDPLPAK